MHLRIVGLVLLAGLPLWAGEPAPDYEFKPLTGHDGRTKLSELYGQPVVFSGFSLHRQDPNRAPANRILATDGIHAAWSADELLGRHGKKGLIVVLRNQSWVAGMHGAHARSFWLRFFSTSPWLTPADGQALPIQKEAAWSDRFLVLVGVDGRLVIEGTVESLSAKAGPDSFRSRFKKAVESELSRRKKGWGEHAAVRRARAALFGKGELAKAWKILERVSDDKGGAELQRAKSEVQARLDVSIHAIGRLLGDGRYLDAQVQLKALQKTARGVDAFEKPVASVSARFDTEGVRSGLKADTELQKQLRPLKKRNFKKFGIQALVKLRAFAKQHEGTPIGDRARRLEPLFKSLFAATQGVPYNRVE